LSEINASLENNGKLRTGDSTHQSANWRMTMAQVSRHHPEEPQWMNALRTSRVEMQNPAKLLQFRVLSPIPRARQAAPGGRVGRAV